MCTQSMFIVFNLHVHVIPGAASAIAIANLTTLLYANSPNSVNKSPTGGPKEKKWLSGELN